MLTENAGMAAILALNAGSSSLKFQLARPGGALLFMGGAQGFGQPDGALTIKDANDRTILNAPCASLHDAAHVVLNFVHAQGFGLSAIGHRIVHGGPEITTHCVINAAIRQALERSSLLAPLHNPPALDVLDQAQKIFPDVPQVACLDTAFHVTLPASATRFPLPHAVLDGGIRRYGFHGLSCESILAQLHPVPPRLVIAHMGGGASVTAIRNGCSVDTSMGLTPIGGVIMETRSGDLDPGLLIYLMRRGQTVDSLERLLNRESGIAGISGHGGDPRGLHAVADKDGRLALDMFASSIAKSIVGMATTLNGLDLLVFTGGIGEHDMGMRESILGKLAWLGSVPAAVMPAQEEAVMLRHCARLVGGAKRA